MYGSGRSTIATKVADRLAESKYSVLRICGVHALQDRPLGAIAASGIDLSSPGNPNAIANAVAALAKAMAAPHPLLVVDDADFLDRTSIGAIVAAHVQRPFPVLMVSGLGRNRQLATAPFNAQIQPAVRIIVKPLRFDELHRLVHGFLPGTVESHTVARIATATGGLPALLRAVVWLGRRNGRIVQVDGRWRAVEDLYSEELGEVLSRFLTDLSDTDVSALTKLALLGSTRAADVEDIIGAEALNSLDDAGLLQVLGCESDPVVAIFPPLVAEYLRRESSLSRRMEVSRELGMDLPEAALANSGFSIYDSTILSTRIHEHWNAEAALLRADWEAHPTAENAVPLLLALHSASAASEEILQVVAETNRKKSAPLWWARLTLWEAMYLAIAQSRVDDGLAVLQKQRAALPQFAPTLDATGAHITFLEDRMPDFESIGSGTDELGTDVVSAVRVECLLGQGRIADALEILDTYDPSLPTYADHGPIFRGLALLFDDRMEEGVEYAQEHLKQAMDSLEPGLIQAHGYVTAFGLALLGRFHEVDTIAASILTLTGSTTLYEQFQRGLLTLAGIAAGWDGRLDYARTLADQARIYDKLGPLPAMLSRVAPSVVYERGPEAADTLWEATADRLDRGYTMAAILVGAAAVEQRPDAALAERVYEVSQGCQSALLRALGAYIRAASSMKADELRAALAQLKATGTAVHLLRAGVRLAVVLRKEGDFAQSTAQADKAWYSVDAPPEVRRGLFQPLIDAIDMSPRELEIATMVTQGMVPNDIALSLSLSVRTVENHISNVYRKLGVSSRPRLMEIMSTWLAGASE
jgi:DNA-binding CsgD family transcriptional regulator